MLVATPIASGAATPVPASLRITVIEDRFTRQWHTYRWTLRRTTLQWAIEQQLMPAGVMQAYTRDLLHYTDLIAGYYVGASISVVQAISDFSVLFFIWDDWHSVAARHRKDQAWQQLSRALREAVHRPADHRNHSNPLVAAFADSVARLFAYLGPAWNARFTTHMGATFEAYDQEYRNLVAGTVPTVAEFLALRRCTFAHDVWIDLLELTAGHKLPLAIRDHDIYHRAAHASQEFASSYNDLCSMPKEMATGDVHNLGICFMRHEGLDAQQAQVKVRRPVADRVDRFLRAETKSQPCWIAVNVHRTWRML